MKKLLILFILIPILNMVGFCAEEEEKGAKGRIVSEANPIYYCPPKDYVFACSEGQKDPLLAISQYGRIDIGLFAKRAAGHAEALKLHPEIAKLLSKFLIPYFQENPYIGSSLSIAGTPSAGWFGGISMVTLTLLDDLMKVQDTLHPKQKMKFLGVGSGNAFFEFLLSHIGTSSAMDVLYSEKLDSESVMGSDSARLRAMQKSKNFFMGVTIYEHLKDSDKAEIVESTFPDESYANTTLVLSWPRDFAIPYIHKFFLKGGIAVLFIRNEAVGSIFDRSHLGELSDELPNFKFKTYLSKLRRLSLPLNTATFSTVDLYCKGKETTPIEMALANTKRRLGK